MDPVAIATAAIAALAPYLVKAGEAVATELGKRGLTKGEAILRALWSRWGGRPDAKERLASYVADPATGREELTATLAGDIAADPSFASALDTLLKGGPPEVFVRQTIGEADEVIGAEIEEMLRGRLEVEQKVRKAGTVTGAKIGRMGSS